MDLESFLVVGGGGSGGCLGGGGFPVGHCCCNSFLGPKVLSVKATKQMETVVLILGLLGQTSLSEIQKWKSEFEVENRPVKRRENSLSAIATRAAQTLFLRLGR